MPSMQGHIIVALYALGIRAIERTTKVWAEEDITVKRRWHTPEQIERNLREVDRLVGAGQTIADAAKQVEISEQTYHRGRNQYGGMKADDAKRLRELERENARLKRLVADKELDIDALREIAKGNW
jgi:putative transposase